MIINENSSFGNDPLHADAVFTEVLVGRRTLAFGTVIAAAAFAVFEGVGFFITDLTGFFFLAHKIPLILFC